jgi:predicted RNA binding protein YcfA (HicA-like mRNA interferase family)
MTYREVERKLRRLGCQEISRRSGGSHRKWMNPVTGQATTVPDWSAKDLKLGTIRGIVRQLGLDWQAFENA